MISSSVCVKNPTAKSRVLQDRAVFFFASTKLQAAVTGSGWAWSRMLMAQKDIKRKPCSPRHHRVHPKIPHAHRRSNRAVDRKKIAACGAVRRLCLVYSSEKKTCAQRSWPAAGNFFFLTLTKTRFLDVVLKVSEEINGVFGIYTTNCVDWCIFRSIRHLHVKL